MTLPADFIKLVAPVLGDELDAFIDAIESDAVTSIRVNTKVPDDFIVQSGTEKVPWCPTGRYLTERPRFTSDPLFHAGCYYVQEASSMFLYQALTQHVDPHGVVLDMCAAPGGKSTLINAFLADDGLLVANEYVAQRAHILSENLQKWGRPNCVVTNNATERFECLNGVFDAVCVDAPCSGEGMFRKDPKAIEEWSPGNVERCVERQRQILADAWQALRPGGVLIYSTCTYNRRENEANVEWLIDKYDAQYLTIATNEAWNIVNSGLGYRFMPHRTRGEGLFIAAVRKGDDGVRRANFKPPKRMPSKADTTLGWLTAQDMTTVVCDNKVYAIDSRHEAMLLYIYEHLNVLTMGVNTAVIKGRDMIPQQSLALSTILNRDAWAVADVDIDTAISYLKAEAIALADVPRGFVLVTYGDTPLGWVKCVGNRCNNLYPSPWRIRF